MWYFVYYNYIYYYRQSYTLNFWSISLYCIFVFKYADKNTFLVVFETEYTFINFVVINNTNVINTVIVCDPK